MREFFATKLAVCFLGLAVTGCSGSSPELEADVGTTTDLVERADSPGGCSFDGCDDDNPCTDDLCLADGSCQFIVLTGQSCDDGNACTSDDTCSADGACIGADAVTCDDADPCTSDTCNPASGCEFSALPDGTSCEDGTLCTTGDACDQGVCVGGEVVKCEDDDETDCAFKVCNAATGECDKTELLAVGSPCKDGDPCTDNDTCSDTGQCEGGDAHKCVAQHPCKKSWCNEMAKEGENPCVQEWKDEGVGCDDGDKCTDQDACTWNEESEQMKCSGEPLDCNDGNPCTSDACDEELGCSNESLVDGTPCQGISDLCSTGGKCEAGECVGAVGNKCSDNNPCTDDICDAESGECTFVDNAEACDDGDLCTTNDTCDSGSCGGSPVDCSSVPSACIQQLCNPLSGQCDLPVEEGTSCDDGDLCNGIEVCAAGQCVAGDPVVCVDDDNPCTDDICNPVDGSCGAMANNGSPCGGDDPCTSGTSCQEGICQPGIPVSCEDDGNDCTQDICNSQDGTCGIAAEDGTACGNLAGWTCLASICQCEQMCDGKACGDDSCGGTCGTCDDGFSCDQQGQCNCEPACDGKECGPNGCGGECGTCDGQDLCVEGQCECQPECTDKDCGTDGCGGNCGSCDDNNDCTADSCDAGTCKHEVDLFFCTNYFYDSDGDKFGVDGNIKCLCEPFGKYTATKGGDCDDDDALSYPDAPEICDGGDNDCDNLKDEDFTVGQACDSDDSDLCENGIFTCKADGSGVECASEEQVDIPEVCGGGDEDCDGKTNEADAEGCVTYYKDKDEDSYGIDLSVCLCAPFGQFTASEGGDCADGNDLIHPGSMVCGLDGDCDDELLDGGEACDDGNEARWDGCWNCGIGEVQVNQFTPGDQRNPQVGAVSNKGHVVVWQSEGQNGQGWEIYGRGFSSDGTATDEFHVNTTPVNHEYDISLGVSGGKYLVSWMDESGYNAAITARLYAFPNVPKGDPFTVGHGQATASLGLASPGFVVFWSPQADNPDHKEVVGQRYGSAGKKLGDQFDVLTADGATKELGIKQIQPLELTNGNIVVLFAAVNPPGCNAIRLGASLLDPEMNLLQDCVWLNGYTCNDWLTIDSVVLPTGGFAVGWNEWKKGFFALFTNDLTLSGQVHEPGINGYSMQPPGVAALSSGVSIVAGRVDLYVNDPEYPAMQIHHRKYDASGAPASGLIQSSTNDTAPTGGAQVVALPNDRFVIIYEGEDEQDSDGEGIFMQVFNQDSTKVYKW